MSRSKAKPAGHDEVLRKEPCPECGSADNLVRYRDGHAHCFTPTCTYWEPPGGRGEEPIPANPKTPRTIVGDLQKPERPDAWDALADRRLTEETLRRFGYFRGHGTRNGKREGVQVAPYFDQRGNLVAQKLRFPDKDFTIAKGEGYPTDGGLGSCQLFGQQFWGERFDRTVVVTEGEIDAMSVAQATGFKFAVVSLATGAQGAEKCLRSNYLWLDRFDDIVLWFDNDEPGRAAVEQCADLFKVGKVRVARVEGFKDASDILKANKPGDIQTAIYAATVWKRPGILSARDVLDRVDFDAPPPVRNALPWPAATRALYGGISKEDVIFLLSGAGKGKSTFLFETISCLEEQGVRVGAMFFEDTLADVVDGILTVRTSKRLRLDPTLVPAATKTAEWEKIAANDRLFLFDGETAQWGLDALLEYVRYLAKGCQCDYVVIDPLSFLIAQSDLRDERKAIDNAVAELAALAKQLHIGILISHHLTRPEGDKGHEEGAAISLKQARGSNGIGQFCTLAIGLRWHPQTGLSSMDVLKSRKQGELNGTSISWLQYDPDTGRVFEVPPPPADGADAPAFGGTADY